MRQIIVTGVCVIILCISITAQQASQVSLAVTQLSSSSFSADEAIVLTDAVRSSISSEQSFRVMERSQMSEILREQGFQQSGACNDQSCLVQMGQLLGVNYLVIGSIGQVGKTFSINIRFVDVASGAIKVDVSRYHKGKRDQLLTRVIPEVSKQAVNTFIKRNSGQTVSAGNTEPKKKSKTLLISSIAAAGAVAVAVPVYLLLNREDDQVQQQGGMSW